MRSTLTLSLIFILGLQKAHGEKVILVAGGSTDQTGTDPASKIQQYISLGDSNADCPEKSETDIRIQATGGVIDGKPIICGGFLINKNKEYSKTCNEPGNPSNSVEMSIARAYAASTVVGNKLWITGGEKVDPGDGQPSGPETLLKTTEYIAFGASSEAGPDLPEKMYGHCIDSVDSTKAVLVADLGQLRKTWEYNAGDKTFTEKDARSNPDGPFFACKMFKKASKTTLVLTTLAKKVYLYDISTSTWSNGPDRLTNDYGFGITPNTAMDSILILGGAGQSQEAGLTDKIWEMTCPSDECKWTELTKKLAKPRTGQIALWVECSGSEKTVATYFGVLLLAFGMFI